MTRIVIADDHAIFREALTSLLVSSSGFEVAGEAANGREAVEAAATLHPDVILLDIGMPEMNGIEAARKIRAEYAQVKILILTQYDSWEYLHTCLEAGASGYLLKHAGTDELISAIRTVDEGKPYLSPNLTGELIKEYLRDTEKENGTEPLTSREEEVLKLLAEGLNTQEIGEKLFISKKTVQTHLTHVMEKLNLNNRTKLIRYAMQHGIVTLDGPR